MSELTSENTREVADLSYIWISTPDGQEKRLPTRRTPEGFYEVLNPNSVVQEVLETKGVVHPADGTGNKTDVGSFTTPRMGTDQASSSLGTGSSVATIDELTLHAQGVLNNLNKEEALNAILRCEMFFETWRVLGGSSKTSGLSEEDLEVVKSIASPEAYYYHAIRWLVNLGKGYLGRMYDWVDISTPITWAEVSYLFFGELDFPKSLNWKDLGKKYTTSVVIDESNGVKTLVMDVNKYTSSVYFTDYLRHIRSGKRNLPYPLVGCYEELRESGLVKHLRPDDILREVTRKEAKALINRLQQLQQGTK